MHHASRANRDVIRDRHAVYHRGARSKKYMTPKPAAPGNDGIDRDMRIVADNAFVLDDGAGIDDGPRADASHGADMRMVRHEASRRHFGSGADSGSRRNKRGKRPTGRSDGSDLRRTAPIVACRRNA